VKSSNGATIWGPPRLGPKLSLPIFPLSPFPPTQKKKKKEKKKILLALKNECSMATDSHNARVVQDSLCTSLMTSEITPTVAAGPRDGPTLTAETLSLGGAGGAGSSLIHAVSSKLVHFPLVPA